MFLLAKLRITFLHVHVSLVLCVLAFLLSPVAHADELYGDNIYGECPYSQACPDSGESPSPTSTPSPSPTTNSANPTPSMENQEDSNDRDTNFIPGQVSVSPPPPGNGLASRDFFSALEKSQFGRFLIQQPATVPIIFFILLLVMALILAIQASLEHRSVIQLRHAVAKLHELQSDVRNFLLVFQHVLRTPMAGLLTSLGLLTALDSLHAKTTPGADTTLELTKLLNSDVNEVVNDAVASLEVISVEPPSKTGQSLRVRQTIAHPSFWGPVVTVVILTGLYHVLTWWLINISLSTKLIILELAVLFAAIVVLFSSIVYRRRTKERKAVLAKVSEEAQQLAERRNAVVTRLNDGLHDKFDMVATAVGKLPETHASLLAKSSLENFGRILQKLVIVQEVQDPDLYAKISAESYDLEQEMRHVIDAVCQATLTKRQIELDATQLTVKSLQGGVGLVNFVLASVLDNAVKYSTGGDVVKVRMTVAKETVLVQVENHNQAIARIDSAKIFTPFMRFEEGLTSDVQGVGISLFVSNVILKRLGGSISIQTRKPDLVCCEVRLPFKIAQ